MRHRNPEIMADCKPEPRVMRPNLRNILLPSRGKEKKIGHGRVSYFPTITAFGALRFIHPPLLERQGTGGWQSPRVTPVSGGI